MRLALFSVFAAFCILCAVVGGGGYYLFKSAYFAEGPLTSDRAVIVPRGASVQAIAARLAEDNVISNPTVFQYGTRLFGSEKPLRAGEFKVPALASAAEVARVLQEAEPVVHKITLPEGLTSAEFVAEVRADQVLEGDITFAPGEGTLMPETYHFHRGMSRTDLLKRAQRDLDKTLDELWATRKADLPIATQTEALILASIVEKETGVADERPLVASVFVNRLKRGMRLQSDPTVVYGITGGAGPLGRSLTRADLDTPTPYNTYEIDRLPPGPICNPGKASIAAVLQPADTKYYYFVADGTGGHAFAETLDQHNKNVRAWRKLQKAN